MKRPFTTKDDPQTNFWSVADPESSMQRQQAKVSALIGLAAILNLLPKKQSSRVPPATPHCPRSDEQTTEITSLMRITYAVFSFTPDLHLSTHSFPKLRSSDLLMVG